MTPFHVFLAVLVAVIWGIAFIATKLGLETFSPPQLTALRFLIAAGPALFVARPPIAWPTLCAVGLALWVKRDGWFKQICTIKHNSPSFARHEVEEDGHMICRYVVA